MSRPWWVGMWCASFVAALCVPLWSAYYWATFGVMVISVWHVFPTRRPDGEEE